MSQIIYFLGAGVSREAGVPTQKELWHRAIEVWKENKDEKIKEILDFAVYLNFGDSLDNIYVDFAELLTLMDLSLEQNVSLGRYDVDTVRKIRAATVQMFCRILQDSARSDIKGKFAGFCSRLEPDDAVICLNYDTVIDSVISEFNGGVYYGFAFDNMPFVHGEPKSLLVLKPHGSMNWLFCRCCNNIYLSKKFHYYESGFTPGFYCPHDRSQLQEVIVSPSYEKRFHVPQLHEVWKQCFQRIKNARQINFIGYSFPPGDIHLIYLIKRAVLAGSKKPEINVIASDSHGKVKARCASIFARYNYFNTSFSDYFSGLS